MCGPAAMVTAAKTAKQFLTYVSGAPFQPAIAVGLDLPDEYFAGIALDLAAKRDHLVVGLRAAGFETFVPEATYFTTVDIRPVQPDGDGMAFCRTLPERVRRRRHPEPGLLRPHRVRPAHGALRLLQAHRGARRSGRRDWRRCREQRSVAAHRRDPARHHVVRSRRQLRAPRPAGARRGRRRRRAGAADRDVLDRLRHRRPRHRRARGRAVVARSSPTRLASTACGSAARARRSRPARRPTTSARTTASCSPGPTARVHRYRKIHPFSFGGEEKHFRAGTDLVTVDVEGLRVSLFVCYDLRFADEFWQLARDTDVYLVPANWPAKRRLAWTSLLQARAIENQAYVVGVNRVGAGRRHRLHRRQPHRRPARRAAGHRGRRRVDAPRRRLRRHRPPHPRALPLPPRPPLSPSEGFDASEA